MQKRLAEMKQYVGLAESDVANVLFLGANAKIVIPGVVDRFYATISANPGAMRVFKNGEAQIQRLRQSLAEWLSEVFDGCYDEAYYERRLRVGRAHVRVGLPQHYMVTAMQVVWEELFRVLSQDMAPERRDPVLQSLHKVLMLDLAVMLESYKESFAEHVRGVERSAVEERLTRAEHLAEIGQLAASLAHEIKNPLAGISGAIQVIRDELAPRDSNRPILSEVLQQINRLDATVKDLLLYARPIPPRTSEVVLGDVVRRVVSVLREEPALQRVKIAYEEEGQVRLVADEGQLEHLVINLLLNAAHASPEGGEIVVRAGSSDGYVFLSVEDSGHGMASDVQNRAFEAFFTTKSKGTGLGLSICRRIVEAHEGLIALSSELGRGTRVRVDFPIRGRTKASV